MVINKLVILITSTILFFVVVFSKGSVQFHRIEAFHSWHAVTFSPLSSRRRRTLISTRHCSFRPRRIVWTDTGTYSSVVRNMILWNEFGLSFFTRSFEPTGKCLELPETTTITPTTSSNSTNTNRIRSNDTTAVYSNSTAMTSFELRVREAAAAEVEAISIGTHYSVQQHTYEVTTTTTTTTTKISSGYQRIEEWDEIQRAKAKNGTWEERVQFDGQKYGNQWNQNEILRRHLKF